MLNPDRAVANRATQSEHSGDLQRPEGLIAVFVGNGFTPCRAQARRRDLGRQALGAGSILDAQLVQRVKHGMFPCGPPGKPAHRHQQRAHRGDGVDQAVPDDRRPTGCAPGAFGRDQIAQARAQFGIRYGLLRHKIGQLLKQLLVLLGPVDSGAHAVGAVPPQVGNAALEHEDELVGGCQQAVAQEAGHLDRARRLLGPGADRGRPGGHAPRIPAHQHVVEITQVLIDAQIRQEGDDLAPEKWSS